jgi:serine protease AprX
MAARTRKLIILLFALSAAFAPSGLLARGTATGNTQSAVWAYGDAHPGASVPVIVQTVAGQDPAGAVIADGGAPWGDLSIIHGVAADVPADALVRLAADETITWVSLDAPIASTARGDDRPDRNARRQPPASDPPSVYPQEIGADALWSRGDQGQGLSVAVVDTGIADSDDFSRPGRIVARLRRGGPGDGYGHGTHVAGLIGGNGAASNGQYTGVAPSTNLVNVKVGDDSGAATLADVITGLQFVLENQNRYNIRVVNLSLVSSIAQSYTTDPLDAAVELLTFRGILVVAAAGNTGTAADAVSFAPANDPFVLTVGAVDDLGTPSTADDSVPEWSSRGTTQDGLTKPEVYAPGRHLVSVLSPGSVLATDMPDSVVGDSYLMLSGTSMSAAVASGAAALVIHAHPEWTPAQVKNALVTGATPLPSDSSAALVRADQAARTRHPADTSQEIKPNFLLLRAAGFANPESIKWGSIKWGSIKWGSIKWGSIKWGSVTWGSIKWGYVPDEQ